MKAKNKGYILPVAIGVLIVASLGLLLYSWAAKPQKTNQTNVDTSKQNSASTSDNTSVRTSANDDATLDSDSAAIDANIKALDSDTSNVDGALNDTSTI